jgi:hypothetical protein
MNQGKAGTTQQQLVFWQLGFVNGDYSLGKVDSEIEARPFPGSCTPLIRIQLAHAR